MAKKRKNKGVKDLLNVDLSTLSSETIKDYFKVARDTIRKALKTWEGKEYQSPAYHALRKSTKGDMMPSFKGKTLNQQKKELAKAVRFVSDETRTVAGWEKQKKINTKALNKKLGLTDLRSMLTPDEYDKFWTAYNLAKEVNPNIDNMEYKYDVMDTLVHEVVADKNKTAEELAIKMAESFQEIYEGKEQQHQENLKNISDMFE